MKAVQNNPYRTVGILVGATVREKERQIKRLKQLIEAEQVPQDDFSFPSLGPLQRTIDNIIDADSKLNLDSDKMQAALFWFWSGNPITDEAAFDSIKEGDIDTAYGIWDKLIVETKEDGKRFWKPVTENNYSAFHNCFLLNLIRANGNLHYAVAANLYFLESDFVNKFISSAVDETYKTTKIELQLLFLNQLHAELASNRKYPTNKLLEIVNTQEFAAKQDFLKTLVQKPIEQIEQKIEKAKNQRKTSKANAAIAGQELYTTTANELTNLKSIIDSNDTKYSSIADKVAIEILQCSIDYYKYSQENDIGSNYTMTTLSLVKQAETIAIGLVSKQRIQGNQRDILIQSDIKALIRILEDKHENQYRARRSKSDSLKNLLGSDSIIKAEKIIEMAKPYLINIKAVLKGTDETYLALSTNIASKAQGIIIETVNNSKTFETAIFVLPEAWKVTQQISSLDTSIEFQNHFRKNKASLKNLCNQVGVDTTETYYAKIPQLNFIIQDSEITNTDKHSKPLKVNPLYHKHTRYIGLKLSVLCFESQEIEFLLKYVNSSGKYKQNSEISNKGYTLSSTRTISPNIQTLDLGGYGNNDASSYEVGTHSIEVWVNGSMIHKKHFTIELSPFQKIEKQIKEAEEELIKIENTTYFITEISSAKAQMNEIQKFHPFRSSSNKQKQIENQQRAIDKIVRQSNDLKKITLEAQNQTIKQLKTKLLTTID